MMDKYNSTLIGYAFPEYIGEILHRGTEIYGMLAFI